MNRDSNGFITTDSELLGFEVPVLYSGASGINVDNQNYVISFTGTAYGSGGKTYQGVAPIVVNNQEDKISAITAPFGVQSPLYFVQDDNSGVVIGFSGDIDPVILSSKLDVSAFEAWQTGQYTNDIATIINNISAISSEIPDVSQFVTSSDLSTLSSEITASIPSTAGLASETYVNENTSGKADKSEIPDVSNFITNASAEETYQTIDGMTGYQAAGNYLSSNALEGYATQDWVTGQGYLTGVDISESANWNEATTTVQTNSSNWDSVTGKLDTTSFSTVSGDFLTAHQDLSDYATVTLVEETSGSITSLIPDTSDFITNTSAETTYQPIGNYLSSNALDGYATQQWVNGEVSSKLDTTAQVITAVTTASVSTGGWFPISVVRSLNGINISADYSYNAVCASADSKGDTFTGNYAKISALSDYQTTAAMSNYATTGDVSYLSAEIGNVEVLLASL